MVRHTLIAQIVPPPLPSGELSNTLNSVADLAVASWNAGVCETRRALLALSDKK